uniref:Uncharacterized protein n=1 Tax=Tanacetum cinerariifolium TaxID=118510 RepID=A0A6L2JBN1_TANCI|nr:hypothetical protein [Tanacetum cinerariifolium]
MISRKFCNAKGYKSKHNNYIGLGCDARTYDHLFAILEVLADAMSVLKDFVSRSLNFAANTSKIIKETATSEFCCSTTKSERARDLHYMDGPGLVA